MKIHKFNDRQFELQLSQIQSIQLVGQGQTIDIQVQDNHVFFANNILTHNSSIESQLVLGDNIGHSLGKLQIADIMVSISRKHQDKLGGTVRYVLVKNRGGADGMVYNGVTDFDIGKMEMYDNYTQKSVETRQKMDNNENLMKQKIKQRLAALKHNKQVE